jgi:hypothetical protein
LRDYVDESPTGRHDLILGTQVCRRLGLVFDFKQQMVVWDDVTTPMKKCGKTRKELINIVDSDDPDLPPFMQKATQRLTKRISANL